ncbi:unnamed protein product, partial [Meganyctiphanes norvegica]
YGYSVAAEDTGTYHSRSEGRDGETVSGSYKVALPDGRVQTVTYVADDDGFRAEVTYEGDANDTPSKGPQHLMTIAPKARKQDGQYHASPIPQNSPEEYIPNTEKKIRQHRFKTPVLRTEKPIQHRFKPSPQTIQKTTANPFGNKFKAQRLMSSSKKIVPTEQPQFHPTPIQELIQTPSQELIPTPAENGHPSLNIDHHLIEHSTPAPVHRPSTFQRHFRKHSIQNNPNARSFIPKLYNIDFEPYASPTTPSPNPFRLVVEKNRASTFSPPPPPSNAPFLSFNGFSNERTHFLANAPTPTPSLNHITTSFNEIYEGVTQNPISNTTPLLPFDTTPASPNIWKYQDHFNQNPTTLYRPKSDAFIHSLGKTHSVPLLLPVTNKRSTGNHQDRSKPHHDPFIQQEELDSRARTYFLSPIKRSSTGGVELRRGDERNSRLTLHIPSPHETDIYPKPRPLLPIF